jgi:putative membrane protein
MRCSIILAGAAFVALSACGDTSEADSEVAATPGDGVAAETAAAVDASADSAVPTTAQGFVDMAAASDMYEIEAGKLARQMSQNQSVKEFGEMMVTDHTRSTNSLKAAAEQVEGVTVAPELSPKHRSDLEALKSAGEDFDRVYAQQQVAAHTQALSMLRGFAERGDAEPLKDFAAKTTPVVEGHLTRARSLR